MDNYDVSAYGKELEAIRKEKLLSRSELAGLLGISYNTLARVLDGDKDIRIQNRCLRAIADFIKKYRKAK